MSRNIDVTIFSANYVDKFRDKVVDQPARTLPNGTTGILYKNWVYPVYKENSDELVLSIFLEPKSSRFGKKSCPILNDKDPLNFLVHKKADNTFIIEEIEEKIIPIDKPNLDQAQAQELLDAKKELDDKMTKAGHFTDYARGLPGDKNKANSGKRRTMQCNTWKK